MSLIKPPTIKPVVGKEKAASEISTRQAINILSRKLGLDGSPSFANITLTDLTASSLVGTNASKLLESVTIGSSLTYTRPTLNAIQDIRTTASPTFVGLTLSGKVTSGSFASPVDVTNTRQYGFELHYSGNNYNVTGLRSRARLKTTDTTATAQGALLQAANEDGINAGVLQGVLIEAIGKSDGNAATISTMRGALVNTEWGAFDTVTNLKSLHVRTHSRNAAGAGSFGTGYGIYIENEAVGGNGQAYDAGIYFKGTNLSAGNKAFTYGIDFSGGTYGTAEMLIGNAKIASSSNSLVVQPVTNSTTFLQIKDAAGTQIFGADTTNGRIIIGVGNPSSQINIRQIADNTAFTIHGFDDKSDETLSFYVTSLGRGTFVSTNRLVFQDGAGSQINFNNAGAITLLPTVRIGIIDNIEFTFGAAANYSIGYHSASDTFQVVSGFTLGTSVGVVLNSSNFLGLGGEIAPETLTEWTHAQPYLTLHNSTHEDTDGGGESKLIFKREDGAGTETPCFQFEASHDGSGVNDQLGKGIWSVNTGAGLVEGMRLDSNIRLGIGVGTGLDPRGGLTVLGDVDILHTAIDSDDHAFEIDLNAAGYGDVKAIDIVYVSGDIGLGEDEEAILVNVDESDSDGGGDIAALEVLATDIGDATIFGLEVGINVAPVEQLSGTFGNMAKAENDGVNALTEFTTSDPGDTNNIEIFVANGDTVLIGNTAKFEEIEFIFETFSNPSVKPTFEFSTGGTSFSSFTPADGTNGMRNNGVVLWLDSDIPSWATNTGGNYEIRITRTRGNLATTPKEDLIQIGTATEYKWDKEGDVSIKGLTLTTDLAITHGGTGQSTAQLAINALSAVSGATNEHVLTKDTATGNAVFKAATGGGGNTYVDRGAVASAYDFTSFTTDGAVHSLDLSGIIPADAVLVDIRVEVSDNLAAQAFLFDKPGRLSTYRNYGGRTRVVNVGVQKNLTVPVTSQAIEYYFDNTTWTTTRLTVLGWWI